MTISGGPVAVGYRRRYVRAHPPIEVGGRVLKVYGISLDEPPVDRFPLGSWLATHVAPVLGAPHPADDGVGFVMLHEGADGTYLLVSEWHGGDMLRHHVVGAAPGPWADLRFGALAPHDLTVCVWELEVVGYERDLWVRTVMAATGSRSDAVTAYLGHALSGWV